MEKMKQVFDVVDRRSQKMFNKIIRFFDRIIEKETKRVFAFNNYFLGVKLCKGGARFKTGRRRKM
jgi:hypothetical protein